MKYRPLKPDDVLRKGDQYLDGRKWYNSISQGMTVAQACYPFKKIKYRRAIETPPQTAAGGKG